MVLWFRIIESSFNHFSGDCLINCSYLCAPLQAKKEKEREEKEKRKDKERREKEKDKERDKDRDREREKEKGKDHSRKDEEIDDADGEESHGHKDDKRREKDKERKHRKRHQSTTDDVSSDKDDKEETKKSRKHGSDRKKSRKVYFGSLLNFSLLNDWTTAMICYSYDVYFSMHIHPNQTAKVGTKNTKKITAMDLDEVVAMRNLKMANLARMGRSNRQGPFTSCPLD